MLDGGLVVLEIVRLQLYKFNKKQTHNLGLVKILNLG